MDEAVTRLAALTAYGFGVELGENIAAIAAANYGDGRAEAFRCCCAWLRHHLDEQARRLGWELRRDEVALIIAARALEARRRPEAGKGRS